MNAPKYSIAIHRTDGSIDKVKVLDARMALQFVDMVWQNETPDQKLELLVILRNGRPYLGCPRPEAL